MLWTPCLFKLVQQVEVDDSNVSVVGGLNRLIESARTLFGLQKRAAYLVAFVEYVRCKARKCAFVPPRLDASFLDKALDLMVGYVQRETYGDAICLLGEKYPDDLLGGLKRCEEKGSPRHKARCRELSSLRTTGPVSIVRENCVWKGG